MFVEGCTIAIRQVVDATATDSASAEDTTQSYDLTDSFESRFYVGRALRSTDLTGWSVRALEETTEMSREHCALTQFNTDMGTCTLVNVSTTFPVLVKVSSDEVRCHRGERKVFLVEGVQYTVHLRRLNAYMIYTSSFYV